MKLTRQEMSLFKRLVSSREEFRVPSYLGDVYFSLVDKRLFRYDADNNELWITAAGKRLAARLGLSESRKVA